MFGRKSLINSLLTILFGSIVLSQAVLAEEILSARLAVEQGILEINKDQYPKIINPNGCEADRGIINQKVMFKTKFEQAPIVMLGLTHIDFLDGANHRITVNTTAVDKTGFTYTFKTWCDTKVWSAKAQWIAIGR
jgi:hypothetical protein